MPKAELARLRRQPAEEEKNIAQIASEFKPEDLSPLLLGEVGDYLLRGEKFDPAAAFYQRLLDDFPKSQMVDFAYNGLGEIAYQKKDYPEALRYFTDGTEKIAAVQKLKDISLGRAKSFSRSESWMKRKRALSRWHRSGNGAAKRPPSVSIR